MEKEKCPECKGDLIENDEEIWCSKCGLVMGDPIDDRGDSFDQSGMVFRPKPTLPGTPLDPTDFGYK